MCVCVCLGGGMTEEGAGDKKKEGRQKEKRRKKHSHFIHTQPTIEHRGWEGRHALPPPSPQQRRALGVALLDRDLPGGIAIIMRDGLIRPPAHQFHFIYSNTDRSQSSFVATPPAAVFPPPFILHLVRAPAPPAPSATV